MADRQLTLPTSIGVSDPTTIRLRLFEAVLVALADHGLTPTAIAARLTYLSAPESLQGALAAGRLVPGLGHPVHKLLDPRTPALLRIAEEEGLRGAHLRLFDAVPGHRHVRPGAPVSATGPRAA